MTTHTITAAGIELVKTFESFRPEPYLDSVGVRTVGFGHVIQPGERLNEVTAAQAHDLLAADLALAGTRVLARVTAPLTDNQFSALASLCFNLGTAPLRGTLGAKLNAGDYAGCSAQFGRWVYAGGRKSGGLVRRRAAERTLFDTPA